MYVIKVLAITTLLGAIYGASFDPELAKQIYTINRPSYCNATYLQTWQCEPCLQNPQIQELQVFYNDSHSGQGYCAYDPKTNFVIIALRGTVDSANWQADFDIIKTDYDCPGCKVHKGFHDVYEDLANNLFACAYTLTSNHPDAKLLITGHSLGAAIGSFAALEIQKYVHNVDIFYNFGQPRVGNAAFRDHIESQLSHLFIARVTHYKDIFVHLPTQDMGFTHYGNEVYLNQDSSTFTVCTGESKNCADQYYWPWQWSKSDHLYYYETCAGCSATACANV